jgi:uncharacterized protein
MLFAVIFTDKPHSGSLRQEHLKAHIDWLETHKDAIPVGGSLRAEPDLMPKGGLWVARAESKSALDALIKTDPFYIAGLRQSYEILHWSKANEKRSELI